MKALFLFLLLIFTGHIFAQTVINGTAILADKNNAAENLTVTLQERTAGPIIGYTTTNTKGWYEFRYKGESDSLIVAVSGINIKKQTIKTDNRSQSLNFILEEAVFQLKEVMIKAPRISQRGDTLNYTVSSFADSSDRTIGDVLKKMPGIQVKESGEILYQDKPLNKFYIENLDLLQGRYGIATNNIAAKDVATVQVMENHQPVKALKDVEKSDQAAINLKLKESAKGTLTINGQAGAGVSPLLLNNELNGMYFTKGHQNITSYKGDNSGRDISKELNRFYINSMKSTGMSKILSVQTPSPPAINQQRFLFNNAHLGTVNNLAKIGKEYTLTTNINYSYDRPEREAFSQTEYYLPSDSILKVIEKTDADFYKNRLSTDMIIEGNTDQLFLKNELAFSKEWDKEKGNSIGEDSIRQHLRNPLYNFSNTLKIVKRNNNKTLQFYSNAEYKDFSQTLQIQPVLYEELFEQQASKGNMIQKIDAQNIHTYNSISLGSKIKEAHINFNFSFKTEHQKLKSSLQAQTAPGMYTTSDSLHNNLNYNQFEWRLATSARYKISKRLETYLSIPLKYTLIDEENRMIKNSNTSGYFRINPLLKLDYKISPMWYSTLTYNYSDNLSGIQNAYTGFIMSNYRDLNRNNGDKEKQRINHLTMYLNYKNPLTTLFGSIYMSYTNTHSNLLNDYIYQGILKIRSTVKHANTAQNLNANIRISQDISSISSTVSLGTYFALSESSQIAQERITDYQSRYLSFSPSFIKRFGRNISLNYQLNFAFSKSKIDLNDMDLPTIKTASQKTTFNISPVKNLFAGLTCEYFYNNSILSGSRNMWFGDLKLKYTWRKTEIYLDYNNIFDTRKYVSTTYNDIARYYNSYKIRPTEVLLRVRFKIK